MVLTYRAGHGFLYAPWISIASMIPVEPVSVPGTRNREATVRGGAAEKLRE